MNETVLVTGATGDIGGRFTEFRAAVIVGSGGISFEMIRYLAERMPVTFVRRHSADEVRVGDALYPIHSLIFSGLIRKLAQRADVLHNTSSPPEDAKKQVSGKDV